MDDLAVCADLCDQHGFPRPAAALRALAEGPPPFYLVRVHQTVEDAEAYGLDPADACPPSREVFLDRASAERHALRQTARALRSFRPVRYFPPTSNHRLMVHYGPPTTVRDQFLLQVGAILGVAYELPVAGAPAFPGSATDEQLGRISQLLDFTLFDVAAFRAEPDPEP